MNVANPSEMQAVPSRVLITGVRGFTGRYLAEALAGRGHVVHGMMAARDSLTGLGEREHVADLLDPAALRALVDLIQPTHVVHLAAIAFVAHGDVDMLYRTNVIGTRNLLDAVATAGAESIRKVLLASSANVYGNTDVSPIDEDVPPRPVNDYAVSKLAMEFVGGLWSDRFPITVVRPFNYTGVGQSPQFLLPKIVKAYRDKVDLLELGNIDVERDFSDVRDVVQAYADLLSAPAAPVVNICSGQVHSLKQILAMAESISGHSPTIRVNPAFVRANEVHRLQGSNERLKTLITGWQTRPIRETLGWMLGES
jgi:nucleoside-diphosphate-sugar epimerase